jgi:predicted component of type VI protein secretion system
MTPDGNMGQIKRYKFTLTDAADSSRTFRCELINQIKIGRQPDNNIVISDDTTVHGHQSTVSVDNDVVKYEDLKQVQNHSAVNGVALTPGIPKLIITNSRVTIGRHTYVVSIEKQ